MKDLQCGMVGLGVMGEPIARNLHRQSFLKAVWSRTAPKAKALSAELGVEAAVSLRELAQKCQQIHLCVADDQAVLSVVEKLLPALTTDHVVIDHSTVSRETACRAAEMVASKGAAFLDAPVSGGVEGARQGTLVIMVGGPKEAFERALPALQALGRKIVHMGEVGSGQATKAVNQIMVAGINQAVTEALAFGEKLGLDLPRVIEVILEGAAGNWFLEKRGLTMIQGQFAPGFKVKLHQKDLKICLKMASEIGFPLPITTQTVQEYRQLLRENYGEEDISALYRLKGGKNEQ